MDDFDKILANMISQVTAQTQKRKAPRERRGAGSSTIPTPTGTLRAATLNPWKDEALVLLAQRNTCKTCGNETFSWNPYIFISRMRVRRGVPEYHQEILTSSPHSGAYSLLPQRIEVHPVSTPVCPQCFGDLPKGAPHYQQQLPLPFPPQAATTKEIH